MPGIRVMTFHPTAGLRRGGEELLASPPADPGAWIWADFDQVDLERERQLLQRHFALQNLAIQDAQRERHPPKHEIFDNCLFLLLRELSAPGELSTDPEFTHVALFAGESFLASRRNRPSPSLDQVWAATTEDELGTGVGHTVYRICRQMVDHYTPVVLEMEARLGLLEDRMFRDPSDAILEELSDYNRILKKLRRTFSYQHGMMKQLVTSDEAALELLDKHELNDVSENMERLASLCQLNQELAVDLLNTYLSLASHKLNQIMRVLTIATVIFLPLGLLAGIYGMNFENMPELGWRYGYFAIVGTMSAVVVTLITVFKHKHWL